jgi:hypothetical protein
MHGNQQALCLVLLSDKYLKVKEGHQNKESFPVQNAKIFLQTNDTNICYS